MPHQAEVEQKARIARANRRPGGRGPEQDAAAQIASSVRDTEIKKAGFQAEIDRANQNAAQQGPLAQATARQAVVQEETKVAELQAEQTEQQLQVDVRKPADAEAYKQTTLAAAPVTWRSAKPRPRHSRSASMPRRPPPRHGPPRPPPRR